MKLTIFLNVMLVALLCGIRGNAQTGIQTKIQAYYFHNQARCVTCKTVEAEAKNDLVALYGDKVTFQSLNLEEESTQEIAKKLKVSGQTLLVVIGDKQVNLTNDGFLYAVNNPEKFKSIIKKKVDPIVN
jgi:hypothetical protein